MKRLLVALAAVAMLLVVTESASAKPWYGVNAGFGWGGPYVGASYGTRVGNSGFLSVGVSAPLGGYGGYGYGGYGYGYPSYGYGYAPAYYSTPVYAAHVYYSTPVYAAPVYYSTPYYYGGPSIGVSYYSGGGRYYRGWR
jgi:hypothetical protein